MNALYRVSFFKRLSDSTGHPWTPPQGSVEVRAASEAEAVALACLKFAKLKDVPLWSFRADYHEATPLGDRRVADRRVAAAQRPQFPITVIPLAANLGIAKRDPQELIVVAPKLEELREHA